MIRLKLILKLTEEETNYLISHLTDYKEEMHYIPKFTGKIQEVYAKDSVKMIDEILNKLKMGGWESEK